MRNENDLKETWKVISEFPNYSVSDCGRIKNNINGNILVGGKDRDGYRQVTLSYDGRQYNRRICRLVAIAFIPNPNNLPQVNHKNENRDIDTVDNLEWCTSKYNNNYGSRTQKTRRKVRCVENNTSYNGVRVASRELNIPYQNIIKSCQTGNIAGGYHWEYVNEGD